MEENKNVDNMENNIEKYTEFENFLLVISIIAIIIGFCLSIEEGTNFLLLAGLNSTIFSILSKSVGIHKKIPSGFHWGWWLGIIGFFAICVASPKGVVETNNNKYDNLEKLQKLKDNGTITQEEFDKEKEKILNND